MASHHDMIDLAGSSSDEDDGVGSSGSSGSGGRSSPELLSPIPSPPTSRRRNCQRQNRKRSAVCEEEEVINVSSSPSLSPAGNINNMSNKSRREQNQEALGRARRWRDTRQRGWTRESNGNAAGRGGSGREVVNLSSPSSPPTNGLARGASAAAAAAGAAASDAEPTPRKMSAREKREAKARAAEWHASRRQSNGVAVSLDDSEVEDDDDHFIVGGGADNEVVNLESSPTSDTSSPVRFMGQTSRQGGGGGRTANNRGRGTEQPRRRRSNAVQIMGSTMRQSRSHAARSTTSAFASSAAASANTRDTQRENKWACPRCTLLNNQRLSRCGACDHENPSLPQTSRRGGNSGGVYDVDNDGTFVLEGNNANNNARRGEQRRFNNSFAAAASGTARDRNEDLFNSFMARELHQQSARASGNDVGWGRQRGRPNFGGGYHRGGGGASMPGYAGSASARSHMLLSHLMASYGGGGSSGAFAPSFGGASSNRDSIDNMSYERLLEVFGDGSENRGASSTTISSLPVSKISNPKDLPEDKRTCYICLEEFEGGEERTSLPCLHGFHKGCVNRWLSSNGTCPVCKTSVSGGG